MRGDRCSRQKRRGPPGRARAATLRPGPPHSRSGDAGASAQASHRRRAPKASGPGRGRGHERGDGERVRREHATPRSGRDRAKSRVLVSGRAVFASRMILPADDSRVNWFRSGNSRVNCHHRRDRVRQGDRRDAALCRRCRGRRAGGDRPQHGPRAGVGRLTALTGQPDGASRSRIALLFVANPRQYTTLPAIRVAIRTLRGKAGSITLPGERCESRRAFGLLADQCLRAAERVGPGQSPARWLVDPDPVLNRNRRLNELNLCWPSSSGEQPDHALDEDRGREHCQIWPGLP